VPEPAVSDGGYTEDAHPRVIARGGSLFPDLARAIFLAAGILVLLWFLLRITWVLLFFTLAAVLALALNAPVTWLERKGIPRVVATIGVFTTLAATAVLVGWLIAPPLVREFTLLLEALPVFATGLVDRVGALLGNYPELQQALQIDAQSTAQVFPWLLGTLRNIWHYGLSLLVTLVLGLVLFGVVVYMVIDPRPILGLYVASLPPHLREPGVRAFARGSQMVVGWVYASAMISAMKAVPAFFFLSWIGLPGALVWSAFTFVADLVPRLGFYLMIIPPTLVALSIDPMMALWVGLFYWGISEILGNLVAPRIQASAMNLHPVFLLFVTLAMVAAFGVLGAIIASPVAGFIKAYYEEFYLARVPREPHLRERVDAILARSVSSERVRPAAGGEDHPAAPPV
jgi:putative permease